MKSSTQRRQNLTHQIVLVSVASVLSLTVSAQAAIYSPPPSWSPMSMLNVTFNTTTQRIDVVDQAVKMGDGNYAILVIDANSNPDPNYYGRPVLNATAYGSFDPNQPWAVLNDTAFSRRIGWNPGSSTLAVDIQSVYGAGAGIWIECLSHSAGFEAYQAVGKWGVNAANTLDANLVPIVDPNAHGYDEIFGTAGSSTKWKWDYLMDHNTYAVASEYITEPNQLFTASYKVYVGGSDGNEILNTDGSSASTLETWTWQGPANVPEPATMLVLALGGLAALNSRRNN